MQHSNIPSSTGITARKSGASIMTNRSAWLQPSSFPRAQVLLTQMSHTISPSPLLTLCPLQSSTSHSFISAYKHPPNCTDTPKCLQMALPILPMPRPSRTASLSRSARSKPRNHLCRPIPLRPHWRHTLTSTPISSEPSPRASSQPLPNATPTRTSKSSPQGTNRRTPQPS
jgi:hypothetical protein